MLKQKIAVFVSGGGTNLQALIDAQQRGELMHGEIALVISSKTGAYALERAEAQQIKTLTIVKKEFPDQAAYEAAMLKALKEHQIDLIVLAGFMTILSGEFVSQFPKRIVNVHPALIPSFSGAGFYGLKVHQAALDYGVKLTGATVHYVNEVPDGGEIISQKAVDVLPGDTPERLQKRVMEQAEWVILPQAVEEICAARSQGNSCD